MVQDVGVEHLRALRNNIKFRVALEVPESEFPGFTRDSQPSVLQHASRRRFSGGGENPHPVIVLEVGMARVRDPSYKTVQANVRDITSKLLETS